MSALKRRLRGLLQRAGFQRSRSSRIAFTRDVRKLRRFEIGEWTYGTPRVRDWGEGATLKIGKYCSIAAEVQIFLGGEHRTDWVTTYPFSVSWDEARGVFGHPATRGDVEIGNDVWIGNGARILSGVKIGDGAVVGTRAVVARDVAPYAIVAGNPARQIRLRFSEPLVEELQKIAWWNWPREEVVESLPLMLSADVEAFVERHRGGSR